jgi:hypothetical protein
LCANFTFFFFFSCRTRFTNYQYSKAEGLNLPGSDYDVMFINKDINVYERDDVLSNYHDLRTKFNLVLDFDNAMPGFTLLRIYDVREWKNTEYLECIHINDE